MKEYIILFFLLTRLTILLSKLDGSTTIFDSSGRLHQIEYAFKATSLGSSIIASNLGNCAIIISWSPIEDEHKILVSKNCRKLSDYLGIAMAGIVSDSSFISNKLFEEIKEHIYLFGTAPPCSRLAKFLSELFYVRTLSGGQRPLGLRALLIGYDEIKNTTIYEIDPLGNCHHCKMSFIGKISEEIGKEWSRVDSFDPSYMTPTDYISKCAELLTSHLNREDILVQSKDFKIIIIGKNIPYLEVNQEIISDIFDRKLFHNFESLLLPLLIESS